MAFLLKHHNGIVILLLFVIINSTLLKLGQISIRNRDKYRQFEEMRIAIIY